MIYSFLLQMFFLALQADKSSFNWIRPPPLLWSGGGGRSIISSLPLLISLGVFGQQIHKSIMVLSFMPWFTQLIPAGLQRSLKNVLKLRVALTFIRDARHAACRDDTRKDWTECFKKRKKESVTGSKAAMMSFFNLNPGYKTSGNGTKLALTNYKCDMRFRVSYSVSYSVLYLVIYLILLFLYFLRAGIVISLYHPVFGLYCNIWSDLFSINLVLWVTNIENDVHIAITFTINCVALIASISLAYTCWYLRIAE